MKLIFDPFIERMITFQDHNMEPGDSKNLWVGLRNFSKQVMKTLQSHQILYFSELKRNGVEFDSGLWNLLFLDHWFR